MTSTNERLYLFDNIKAILITFMVFGHFLILFLRDSGGEFYQALWMGIYSFHMPAFFFISGILEKKRTSSSSRSTVNLLIYYMLMCGFVFLIRNGAGIETHLSFIFPPFAAWFLLVLFIFKLFLPIVKDMRHVVILAISISLVGGMFDDLGMFLSLQRAAAFSVFFMMGYFIPSDAVQKLRGLKLYVRSILALLCFSLIIICAIYLAKQNITLEIYFNKLPYNTYFDNQYIGLLGRAMFIGTSVLGIIGLLLVAPQKRMIFSYVGKNSVSIYFFHTVVFYLLMLNSFDFITQNGLLLLLTTLVYVLIAGAQPFAYGLNQIVNLISRPFFKEKGA